MQQYLAEIKSLVDQITAARSSIDIEDIILYILNGLLFTYQTFKTSILTRPRVLTVDDLYPLLLSEEILITAEHNKEDASLQTALYSSSFHSRGRWSNTCGHGRSTHSPNSAIPMSPVSCSTAHSRPRSGLQCQICYKLGHTAAECWHLANLAYVPAPHTSLIAANSPSPAIRVLDSGASSHMTADLQLSLTEPYFGSSEVLVGNGTTIPIQYTRQGFLPTPRENLQLSTIHHVPHLSHNLLSISHLTIDNQCYILLDEFDFSIKDRATHKTLLAGRLTDEIYQLRPHHAYHATLTTSDVWHRRLGHPHQQVLQKISSQN